MFNLHIFQILLEEPDSPLRQLRTPKNPADFIEQPFCLSMYRSLTALQESNYLTCNIHLLIKSLSWYMNWNELSSHDAQYEKVPSKKLQDFKLKTDQVK